GGRAPARARARETAVPAPLLGRADRRGRRGDRARDRVLRCEVGDRSDDRRARDVADRRRPLPHRSGAASPLRRPRRRVRLRCDLRRPPARGMGARTSAPGARDGRVLHVLEPPAAVVCGLAGRARGGGGGRCRAAGGVRAVGVRSLRRRDPVGSHAMLSVVVPPFNEEQTLPVLHARLAATLAPLGPQEIVLVDDGSSDASWQVMTALADADVHVRLVRLSRNFGHQAAITAGLDAASGDVVVTMDGDLQDPPELIPELLARWRDGYEVVYAVRDDRAGEARWRLAAIALFYKLMRRISGDDIRENVGDFRLMSRRAVDALASMPERARFLRG